MADYAKKTVAELTEILKSRSLPSSGKKAELIARLNEHDKQTAEAAPPASAPEPTPVAEPVEPVVATAAATASTAPNPETQSTALQPSAGSVSAAEADHPSPDTALAAQTSYSLNLPTSTLDTELAKRKARADRFGTGAATTTGATESSVGDEAVNATSETDAAALKNLERAKRFGTGQTAISKLDEALPSEMARGSRKRNHAAVAEPTSLDDPGLKRSFMSRGRGRGGRVAGKQRGGGRGPPPAAGAKPQGVQKAPAFTSEKDKLAAEARKKKFATA